MQVKYEDTLLSKFDDFFIRAVCGCESKLHCVRYIKIGHFDESIGCVDKDVCWVVRIE